jgi:surface antigen
MSIKNKLIAGIFVWGIVFVNKVIPQNILDSAAYQPSKDLDNMHMFLGKIIPKHLFIQLSEKDKDLTLRLLNAALETSPSFLDHNWTNIDNQHQGKILVYPVEVVDERKCRKFLVRLDINDEHFSIQGQSCRENGQWNIISTD